MRRKENANDYRYFPDPDLPPIENSIDYIEGLKAEIPVLPDVRKAEYIREYGLNSYDAERIINDLSLAEFFEEAVKLTSYPKQLANMLSILMLRRLKGKNLVRFQKSGGPVRAGRRKPDKTAVRPKSCSGRYGRRMRSR